MIEKKHTPGPIERNVLALCQRAYRADDEPTSEQLVAILGMERGDLRLADAAPDLLAASEALIEQLECELGPCDGSMDSRMWPTANDLRAAIAKAKGGAA